jgi:Carboxypeptidase regulatory-like domain
MPELRAVAVLVVTVLVLTGSGCRHPVMVADAGPKPAEPAGTISGQLRTPGGGAPVVGRLVTAVNNANGQRFQVRTGNTGGFTLKVPPGSYRLEVELQSGEGVTGAPTDQRVGESDVDANIVITVGPLAGTGQHESRD